MNNKITRILNTSARSVPNPLKNHGVIYQSFNWIDSDQQVIIDDKFDIPMKAYDFIDLGLEKGESIQVHSVKGMNRSVVQICIFLMMKLRWSVDKCLHFQISKKKTIKLRKGFHKQLNFFEKFLVEDKGFVLNKAWTVDNQSGLDYKASQMELLLTNTYQNAATRYSSDFSNSRLLAQNVNAMAAPVKETQHKPRKGIKWTQEVRRFMPKKKQTAQKVLGNNDKSDGRSRSKPKGIIKFCDVPVKSETKVVISKNDKITIKNENQVQNMISKTNKPEEKTGNQTKSDSNKMDEQLRISQTKIQTHKKEQSMNDEEIKGIGKLNKRTLSNPNQNNNDDEILNSTRKPIEILKYDENSTKINNIGDLSDRFTTPINTDKATNKEVLNKVTNNRKTQDFESSLRVENISMSKDNTSIIKDNPSPISTIDQGNNIQFAKLNDVSDDVGERKLTMMKDNKKVNIVLVSNNNKTHVINKRLVETESSISKDIHKSPNNLTNYNKSNGFYNTHEDFTTNTSMQNKTQEAFTDKKIMNNNFENNPELYGIKKPVKGFNYNSPDFFKKVDKFMKPNPLQQKAVKTKEFKINTLNNQSLNRTSHTQASHIKEARSVDQNNISVQGYNKNSMSKNRMLDTPVKNANNTVQNMNFYNNSSYPGAKFLDNIDNNKASHINGKKIYFKTDTNFVKNKSQYQKDRMIKANYGVTHNDRDKFVQIDKNEDGEFRPKTSVTRNYKMDPHETFTPTADKNSKKKRPNSVKIMKINEIQADYQTHSTYLTGQSKYKGGAFVGNQQPIGIVKGQKQQLSQNYPPNGMVKQDPNRMNKYRDFMKKQKDGKK